MDGPTANTATTTKINRRWFIKTSVYLLAFVGFGLWGLWDGMFAYPKRGRAAASYLEWQYLVQASEAGRLLRAYSEISDPVAEYQRLSEEQGATDRDRDYMEARFKWLQALHRVGDLDSAIPDTDPVSRMTELKSEWETRTQPKPLSAFDIPSQWLIAVGGLGVGAWIVFVMFKASSKRYAWKPDERRLTLPGGRSITPDDITEVDKRKWDKFFVFLRLRDGEEIKLDLLRYVPLEEWVLEMEKHTEGYEPPPEAPPEETTTPESSAELAGTDSDTNERGA